MSTISSALKLFLVISSLVCHNSVTNCELIEFLYDTEAAGKIAPLLPEEFVTNALQHRVIDNGFSVNVLYAGAIWYSFRRRLVRFDYASHNWASNNATAKGPRVGVLTMLLVDYGRPGGYINITSYKKTNLKTGECTTYSVLKDSFLQNGLLQVVPKDYLRVAKAIYAGQEKMPVKGLADKWVVFVGQSTVTFYFDSKQNLIRYDFTVQANKIRVVTEFLNTDTSQQLSDDIFVSQCV